MVIKHNLECDTEDLCKCKSNIKEPLHECAMKDGLRCTCCIDCENHCKDFKLWSDEYRQEESKSCPNCKSKPAIALHVCIFNPNLNCNCCDNCQGLCIAKFD